jgi:hypothetical protein
VDVDKEEITFYQKGERTYQMIEVAGFETIKPLAPFEGVDFEVQRVFIMAHVQNNRAL